MQPAIILSVGLLLALTVPPENIHPRLVPPVAYLVLPAIAPCIHWGQRAVKPAVAERIPLGVPQVVPHVLQVLTLDLLRLFVLRVAHPDIRSLGLLLVRWLAQQPHIILLEPHVSTAPLEHTLRLLG